MLDWPPTDVAMVPYVARYCSNTAHPTKCSLLRDDHPSEEMDSGRHLCREMMLTSCRHVIFLLGFSNKSDMELFQVLLFKSEVRSKLHGTYSRTTLPIEVESESGLSPPQTAF